MKNKSIFLPMALLMGLFLASCGSDKVSSLSADPSKEIASSSGVSVQSILSNVDKGNFVEGELIVKFKSGVVANQSVRTHQALGASVVKRFSSFPNLERIKLPAGLSVKEGVSRYMSDPNVEYAEPNYVRRISFVPNDNFFGQQWALQNAGQFAGGTSGADIKATEAWDIRSGDGSIVIAVLDTGIDLNHSDLVNNIWVNPNEIPTNGVDDDTNGKIDDWRGWDFTTCANFDLSNVTINTPLNGGQEVPPVTTSANGNAVMTVNLTTGAIGGTVTFSGLGSNATSAHIYQGSAGTNGSIIVNLTGGGGGTSGTWTIPATTLTAGQLNALLSNGLYFNVRSTGNPAGEIRGQIIFHGTLNCITTKTESNDPSDDNGHGTHVSGTIGAVGNNHIGTSGVMWSVQIMALKIFNADGMGSIADEIAAIDYVVMMKNKGVKIKAINASFGSSDFSLAEKDAIASANAAGIIFVAAAGNAQTDNDLAPEFPAAYGNPRFGGLINIISVAATDQNDMRASFSGYGLNSVHVAAPGVYILSTVPTSMFPSGYDFMSGTSMATPHVTGLVGLLSSYYDGFTYIQIRSTILRSVDVLPSLDRWIQTGGRINAYRALSSLETPAFLTVTATSSSQISLAWDGMATAEDGYRIERKSGSGSFTEIATVTRIARPDVIPQPPVAYTFADSGLNANTTYTYRVRAFNSMPANSAFSVEASAMTPSPTPDPEPSSGGGGGGCSIGARQNTPTAMADLGVLLMPLLIMALLRRRR